MRPNNYWKEQFHILFERIQNNDFIEADNIINNFCHDLEEASNHAVGFSALIAQLSQNFVPDGTNAFYWLNKALTKNYLFGRSANAKKLEYIEKIFNVLQSNQALDDSALAALLTLSSEWKNLLRDYINSADIYFLTFNNSNIFSQIIRAKKKTELKESGLKMCLDRRIANEKNKLDQLLSKASLHLGESNISSKCFFDFLNGLVDHFLDATDKKNKNDIKKYFSIFEKFTNQCIEQKLFSVLLFELCKKLPAHSYKANALHALMLSLNNSAIEKDIVGVAQTLSVLEKILSEAIAQKQFSVLLSGLCEKPTAPSKTANALGALMMVLVNNAFHQDTSGVAQTLALLEKILSEAIAQEQFSVLLSGLCEKSTFISNTANALYALMLGLSNSALDQNTAGVAQMLVLLEKILSEAIVQEQFSVLLSGLCEKQTAASNKENALRVLMRVLVNNAFHQDTSGVAQTLALLEKILSEAIAQEQFSVLLSGLCEKQTAASNKDTALGALMWALSNSALHQNTAGVAQTLSLFEKILECAIEKEKIDYFFDAFLLEDSKGGSSVSRMLFALKHCSENKDAINAEKIMKVLNIFFEQGSNEAIKKIAKNLKESLVRDLSGIKNQEENKEKIKQMIKEVLKKSKISLEKITIISEEMGFSLEELKEGHAENPSTPASETGEKPEAKEEGAEFSELPVEALEEKAKPVSPIASEHVDEVSEIKTEDSFSQRLEASMKEVEGILSHEIDSESDKQKREAFYMLLEQADKARISIPDKALDLLGRLQKHVSFMQEIKDSLNNAQLVQVTPQPPSYELVLDNMDPFEYLDTLQAQCRVRFASVSLSEAVEFDPFSEQLIPVVAEEAVKIARSAVRVQRSDGTVEERVVEPYNPHALFAAASAMPAGAAPEKTEEQKLAEILAWLSVPSGELPEARIPTERKGVSA